MSDRRLTPTLRIRFLRMRVSMLEEYQELITGLIRPCIRYTQEIFEEVKRTAELIQQQQRHECPARSIERREDFNG